MRKLILIPFLTLTIVLLFLSCEDCEDTSEPVARISLHSGLAKYDKVKLLQTDSTLDVFEPYAPCPLSIISDTTTLVFLSTNHSDTLSIGYNRNFDFESRECGFTVTLNNFRNLQETTFDSVLFKINESTNSYPFELKRNEYVIEIFN